MRGLLLLAIVLGASSIALVDARIGLYAYIWFGLMRPDYPAYVPGFYNFSLYLALGLILGSWRFLANIPRAWLTNPITLGFLVLQIPVFLASNTQSPRYQLFIRMSIVMLFIPVLIVTLEDLKRLYLVTAVSLGIWGLWHGATGMLHGGLRISAGIGGFMSENNTFACGLTMIIPFCWYTREFYNSKWIKTILLAMVLGSMACIVLTFSRGAAIALGIEILLISMQSKQKTLTLVAVLLCGLMPAVYLVREAYFKRLGTIATYEQDNSAMSRIDLMKTAVKVWRDHPLLGVGIDDKDFFAASNPYLAEMGFLGKDHVVHNSYLWILAQCGIFAFLAFIYLLFGTLLRMLRSARKLAKTNPAFQNYPRTLVYSLMAYSICSVTQPRATFDFFYIIVMYGAAWYVIAQNLPQPGEVSGALPPGRFPLAMRPAGQPVSIPFPAQR
jgi:putative inorganic carbon (hco3(-)) transporter